MNSHITHIDREAWIEDARFPGVALQLLVSQAHTPVASMIHVQVDAGKDISKHVHATETEFVYIISGEAVLVMDDIAHPLTAGTCVVIAPGTVHSLHNPADKMVEILAFHCPPTR